MSDESKTEPESWISTRQRACFLNFEQRIFVLYSCRAALANIRNAGLFALQENAAARPSLGLIKYQVTIDFIFRSMPRSTLLVLARTMGGTSPDCNNIKAEHKDLKRRLAKQLDGYEIAGVDQAVPANEFESVLSPKRSQIWLQMAANQRKR